MAFIDLIGGKGRGSGGTREERITITKQLDNSGSKIAIYIPQGILKSSLLTTKYNVRVQFDHGREIMHIFKASGRRSRKIQKTGSIGTGLIQIRLGKGVPYVEAGKKLTISSKRISIVKSMLVSFTYY